MNKTIIISIILVLCFLPLTLAGKPTQPPPPDTTVPGAGVLTPTSDGFIKYVKGVYSAVDTTGDIKAGYKSGTKYETYRAYVQFDISNASYSTINNAVLKIKVTSDYVTTRSNSFFTNPLISTILQTPFYSVS